MQEEVTADEIAEVVARWTGVPVARLLEGERQKFLKEQWPQIRATIQRLGLTPQDLPTATGEES